MQRVTDESIPHRRDASNSPDFIAAMRLHIEVDRLSTQPWAEYETFSQLRALEQQGLSWELVPTMKNRNRET